MEPLHYTVPGLDWSNTLKLGQTHVFVFFFIHNLVFTSYLKPSVHTMVWKTSRVNTTLLCACLGSQITPMAPSLHDGAAAGHSYRPDTNRNVRRLDLRLGGFGLKLENFLL